MRKKYFYILLSIMIFTCFCSCMENNSSDSDGGKRALDGNVSETQAATEVTTVTTVTTFTPLETFVRITAVQKETSQLATEKEKRPETNEIQIYEEEKSQWFSENQLFDMEMMEERESDFIETWYSFSEEDEASETTVTEIKSN